MTTIRRTVQQKFAAQATQDGAGVALYRPLGQPALRELDPFLLLDEMHSEQADDYIAGFPSHPHRGFETLSYMVQGKMRHRDSRGNEGVISSGGAQWMRAARGIVHSEIPEQENGLLWGYQLWINLPASKKGDKPQYYDIPAEKIPSKALQDNGFINVIAGKNITSQPGPVVRDDIDFIYLDVALAPNTHLTQAIPRGHTALAYVANGEANFGDDSTALITKRTIAVFAEGDYISATAGKNAARFLLIAGQPINEPIVRSGPFVMNTKAEIDQAILDYQNGVLA